MQHDQSITLSHLQELWAASTEGRRLRSDLKGKEGLEAALNATTFSIVLRLATIRQSTEAMEGVHGRVSGECLQIEAEARFCLQVALYLLDHAN